MNNVRILFGAVASLGIAVIVACGSSSSGTTNGGGGQSQDSGTNSPGSGDATVESDGAVGTQCVAPQVACIGLLGNSCVDPGGSCLGTTVAKNECSATQVCPNSQVCCTGYVTADGGAVEFPDAAAFADGGTGGGAGLAAFTGASLEVTCRSACATGGLNGQVCALDGTGPACPSGTFCQQLIPAILAPSGIPSTFCAPPLPDAGAFPRRDAAAEDDGGTGTEPVVDSGTAPQDAAAE